MSTTSRIPAAIDALLAACRTALPAVSVVDGPPLDWDQLALVSAADEKSTTKYLFVGVSTDDDSAGSAEQDFNAAGAVSRDERGELRCVAYAWSGDTAMKGPRDDAFGIVGAVEQVIRTDPSLGGAVLYSLVSGVNDFDQVQNGNGANAWVHFTISFRAYLS